MKYKEMILFAAGLIVGGVGTWLVVRKHYEDLANEEIESVKEYYKQDLTERKEHVRRLGKDKAAMADSILYRDTVQKTAYSRMSEEDEDMEIEKEQVIEPIPDPLPEPYVIAPEQYIAEARDFDKVTVTWYVRNKALVSEDDELIEVETSIGEEALEHFEECGDHLVVYVRNERLEIDYEVILDEDDYYPVGG